MDGIILIKKPVGWTSRDVCNKISHILHADKVGHSGTLDPFAEGLMFVAVNKGTKTLPYLFESPKIYRATLKLGTKTNSGDLTGKIIETREPISLTMDQVNIAVQGLKEIKSQIPPMTSAVHVDGKKLYELAHKGIEIERKPREITVFDSKLIQFDKDSIIFEVAVSKGTYVRTLGESLAELLNTVGHLVKLERIQIGNVNIKDAIDISEVNENSVMDPINFIDGDIVEVDEKTFKDIKDGKRIKLQSDKEKVIVSFKKKVLAAYSKESGDIYKCERGLW